MVLYRPRRSEPRAVVADADPCLPPERLVVMRRLVATIGRVEQLGLDLPLQTEAIARLQIERLVARQHRAEIGARADIEHRRAERQPALRPVDPERLLMRRAP